MSKCELCGNTTEELRSVWVDSGSCSYALCTECRKKVRECLNVNFAPEEIITEETEKELSKALIRQSKKNSRDLDLVALAEMTDRELECEKIRCLRKIHARMGWLTFIGIMFILNAVLVVVAMFTGVM